MKRQNLEGFVIKEDFLRAVKKQMLIELEEIENFELVQTSAIGYDVYVSLEDVAKIIEEFEYDK